jgi:hypothetical protein
MRGNYVPALDPELELTAPAPASNARWRVRDNLLGNAGFSPQVHLTPETTQDCRQLLAQRSSPSGSSIYTR